MDLEIMASVQEHIIGNCLCVLGDAMAMPIGSMIAKFREEFEAHIEAARVRAGYGERAALRPRARCPGSARRNRPAGCSPDQGAGDQAPGEPRGRTGNRSGGRLAMPRPAAEDDHLHDRRPRGRRRPRTRCSSTRPSTATSRSRCSATSRSSASRSAPAACAWSRSRASRSCRPAARRPVQGRHGRVHPDRARQDRPAVGGRVPADQPSARLPRVRQGRRVPAAGHHLRLGRRASRASSSPSATSSSRSSSRR